MMDLFIEELRDLCEAELERDNPHALFNSVKKSELVQYKMQTLARRLFTLLSDKNWKDQLGMVSTSVPVPEPAYPKD